MSKLIVDPTTVRSLDHLEGLYETDRDKFDSIIKGTSRPHLDRLFKNSIARQKTPGWPDGVNDDAARLVEVLIHNNILSLPGDKNEEEFEETLSNLTDNIVRLLLKISIVRYSMLKF